jgi:hypothetical protein
MATLTVTYTVEFEGDDWSTPESRDPEITQLAHDQLISMGMMYDTGITIASAQADSSVSGVTDLLV